MLDSSDEIFLLEADSVRSLPVRPMRTGLFGKTLEDALQTLLQRHPEVIPGKQIDASDSDPPKFVLLRREMPIGSWSLDHLFVDQKAVLTLVETKLIQNPEARREVIGQAIEYAANAANLWSNGVARQKATDFWSAQEKSLDEFLAKEFGEDLDIDAFWNSVEDDLKRGKIRLMIAADELRPEVRRMIEYLNEEMRNAEVLGLELKCYGEDSGSLVLVPRIVGQTQQVADRKASDLLPIAWSLDRLRTTFDEFPDEDLGKRLRKALDWAEERRFFMETKGKTPQFGLRGRGGKKIGSFNHNGTVYLFIAESQYIGDSADRDQLVSDLKQLQMLEENLDLESVVHGRNLARNIKELSEEQFDKFLEVFAKYCG